MVQMIKLSSLFCQIQGTEANLQITSPLLQKFQAMYNEGAPEYVVDQGLYYPPATNYGYFCTGMFLQFFFFVLLV